MNFHYFDNHATTPVDPRVIDVVSRTLADVPGNPFSIWHREGWRAREVSDHAAKVVAEVVDCEAREVIFTSGATEALRVAVEHSRQGCSGVLRVACSPIEHRSLIEPLEYLESAGLVRMSWLEVNGDGLVSLDSVDRALEEGQDLLCLMWANNEIGTIQPIGEAGQLAEAHNVSFLVDSSQALSAGLASFASSGATYMAVSSHKLYGPKGVGALLTTVRHDTLPHLGTPNVPGIAGFAEAVSLCLADPSERARIRQIRDALEDALLARIDGLRVQAHGSARLDGNLHVIVPGVPADLLLSRIGDRVAASDGAACSSGTDAPSHVLRAIGLPNDLLGCAIRFGVGRFNTMNEVEEVVSIVETAVINLRQELE